MRRSTAAIAALVAIAIVLAVVVVLRSSEQAERDQATSDYLQARPGQLGTSGGSEVNGDSTTAAAPQPDIPALPPEQAGRLQLRELGWLEAEKRVRVERLMWDARRDLRTMRKAVAEVLVLDGMTGDEAREVLDDDAIDEALRADLSEFLTDTEVNQVMRSIGGHATYLLTYKDLPMRTMTVEEFDREMNDKGK